MTLGPMGAMPVTSAAPGLAVPAGPAALPPLTGEIPEPYTPVPPDLAAKRIQAFEMLYGPFTREQVKTLDGKTLEYAVFSQTFCQWDGAAHPPGTAKCRLCGRNLPKQTARVRLPLSFITDVTTEGGMRNLWHIFAIYPAPPAKRAQAKPKPKPAGRTRAKRSTRPIPTEWPAPVL